MHEMTAAPNVWKWQFKIGDDAITGKTETAMRQLAIRSHPEAD
jgi:hypothetical protein